MFTVKKHEEWANPDEIFDSATTIMALGWNPKTEETEVDAYPHVNTLNRDQAVFKRCPHKLSTDPFKIIRGVDQALAMDQAGNKGCLKWDRWYYAYHHIMKGSGNHNPVDVLETLGKWWATNSRVVPKPTIHEANEGDL